MRPERHGELANRGDRRASPWLLRRSTSAAKANSAISLRSVTNRSRSWPSVNSRIAPRLKRVISWGRSVLSFLVASRFDPRPGLAWSAFESRIMAGGSVGCNFLENREEKV